MFCRCCFCRFKVTNTLFLSLPVLSMFLSHGGIRRKCVTGCMSKASGYMSAKARAGSNLDKHYCRLHNMIWRRWECLYEKDLLLVQCCFMFLCGIYLDLRAATWKEIIRKWVEVCWLYLTFCQFLSSLFWIVWLLTISCFSGVRNPKWAKTPDFNLV